MFAVSVVDHFNGNYSVCCPPTPMPQASPCGRTIFSIRLSFTRFFAYQVMKRDESIDQKFATIAKRERESARHLDLIWMAEHRSCLWHGQTEGQTLPLLEPIYTEVEQGPCVDTDLRVSLTYATHLIFRDVDPCPRDDRT